MLEYQERTYTRKQKQKHSNDKSRWIYGPCYTSSVPRLFITYTIS